jgi:hypothetical protein
MIIEWISQAYYYELFAEPVDCISMGLHDYLSVITEPMDFKTLTEYTLSDEFFFIDWIRKARLIWKNASLYNPPTNAVHNIALRIGDLFERKVSEAQMHPDDEDASLLKHIFYSMVSALAQEEVAVAFCEPVDILQVLSYSSVVAMPSFFRIILERLENNFYLERHHIQSDVDRIWDNAIQFNTASSAYGIMATQMQSLSNRLFASRRYDVVYVPACTKMQLLDNMALLTDTNRISVMSELQNICPDAIVDIHNTSVITIDMLNRAQFFRLDMFVRRLLCVNSE